MQNSKIILLTETQLLYNQDLKMQNRFENHQLVMHNDPADRFKCFVFLKENDI